MELKKLAICDSNGNYSTEWVNLLSDIRREMIDKHNYNYILPTVLLSVVRQKLRDVYFARFANDSTVEFASHDDFVRFRLTYG